MCALQLAWPQMLLARMCVRGRLHGLNEVVVGASHEALVHVLTLSLHVDGDS